MVTTEYRLGELCTLRNGYAFKSGDYVKDGIPVIRISNIKENESSTKNAKRVKSSEKFNDYLIKKGDILIAMSGATTGKFGRYISEEVAYQNQRVGCFVIKNEKKLNQDYLYLLLKQLKPRIEADAYGGGQPNISSKTIEQYKVEIPSIDDQKRISSILEKTDFLIKQREESIVLAEEFLKHLYLKMFGTPYMNPQKFEVGTIRDLVSEVKYGTSKSSSQEGKFAYLRMNNITYEGNMDYSSLKYIDLEQDEISKYGVKKYDLLFNRTNSKELVGKTAVFMEDEYMVIAGYLIRVRVNEQANPWFIWGYLNSMHGKRTLYGMCKSIVGMANINAQEFQNIKILLPPPKLQNKFADIVDQIGNLKKQYQKSLAELHELYRSLSHKAFNGELTINEKIEIEGSLKIQPKISGNIEVTETKEDEDDGYRSFTNDRTEPWHFGLEEIDANIKNQPSFDKEEVSASITHIPFLKTEEDLLGHISKSCPSSHFTFEDIKEAVKGLDWTYDFVELKNLVFSLVRKKHLKQVFADAAYKAGFNKADAAYKEITDLSEQIYFKKML